jgi:hypothetical protein
MTWIIRLSSRRRIYDDLAEKIRGHLEEKFEELVASGLSRAEPIKPLAESLAMPPLIEATLLDPPLALRRE